MLKNLLTNFLGSFQIRKDPMSDIGTLKDAGDTISESLANIFNLSLQSGIFLDDWKLARIKPIYKDCSKTEYGNHRPISVISIVAKVFEKLVCNQLRSFMK